MQVLVDPRARHLFQRHRAGQVVLISLLGSYVLPTDALAVAWCGQQEIANDPAALLVGEEQGVPIYAYARVAAYARWHVLHLTMQGPRWWPELAVAGSDAALRDLLRWERRHPGLAAVLPSPAA